MTFEEDEVFTASQDGLVRLPKSLVGVEVEGPGDAVEFPGTIHVENDSCQ